MLHRSAFLSSLATLFVVAFCACAKGDDVAETSGAGGESAAGSTATGLGGSSVASTSGEGGSGTGGAAIGSGGHGGVGEGTGGGGASPVVCGDAACGGTENGSSCPSDCCDALTPCDATRGGDGSHYCRSMNGGPYDWITPEIATLLCDDPAEACGAPFVSTYACAQTSGVCAQDGPTLGWLEGSCP
jgi:hypothetical protein